MRTRITATITAALLLATLTACGSSSDQEDTVDKAKAAAPTAEPSKSSVFLRPTPDQEKTLIAALTAIDPGLTVKEERAISRSVGVCDDMLKGKDDATVAKNAALRYGGGDATVDEAKGARIAAAIKDAYCKA